VTTPLAPSFCTRCGTVVQTGAHFCAVCGNDVSGQQASLATEQIRVEPQRAGGPDAMWAEQAELLREATLGEYEILGELGRGGMAAVYLGHEIALDRRVAIKVMSPALVHGDGMIERFKREARTAASLSHPNIIPVYAVRETERLLYFVMKFIAGRPLDSVLKELGPLPIPMVQMILNQVGGAFGYAHRRGIIHRDIKPANIMIDDEGWAVVTDFGIAKVSQAEGLTMTGMTVGTPTYMSPEQCMAQDVTGASDQYSLGVVAYEMITGRPPFTGGSMMAIMYGHFNDPPPDIDAARPDCPPALRDAVLRMLEKDPAKRFPTMEAAVEAIGEPPPKSDDAMRSQLVTLAQKSENTKLLQRLSTPISPTPLTKRTKAAPSGGPARTLAATAQARTAPARPQTPATVVAGAPAPAKRKTPLVVGLVAVAAVAGVLGVLQPWKSKAAEATPPAAVDTQATVAANPVVPEPAPVVPEPTPQPAPETTSAEAQPPAPEPAQPVTRPTGPSPAALARLRSEFTRLTADVATARQRAAGAGATAQELQVGDRQRSEGTRLGVREEYAAALNPLRDAIASYGLAETAAKARALAAQGPDSRIQPQPGPVLANQPPETRPANGQPSHDTPNQVSPIPGSTAASQPPANPPAAQPTVTDERPLIENAFLSYARATSAGDLDAMLRYYPGLPKANQDAFKAMWKEKYTLDTSRWKVLSVDWSPGEEKARLSLTGASLMRQGGKTQEVPGPRRATLEKSGGGWRITSLE